MGTRKNFSEWIGLALVTVMLVGVARLFYPLMQTQIGVGAVEIPTDELGLTVVIDAGHGGEDGGAVGVNGVLERDINLSVARMLFDMLSAAGVDAVMTRTEDRLLYTEEQNIVGHRKENDLRNRLVMSESYENGLLVSIHMNRFPQESCRGLQVYYSPNDERSAVLAQLIQAATRKHLQSYNIRKTKAAGSSIYLLHRSGNPAVMIECGFLSNAEECENLSSEDYQRRLSFVIFCGIIEYINSQKV